MHRKSAAPAYNSVCSQPIRLRTGICIALELVILAFASCPSSAAVIEAWVQRYSNVVSNSTDEGFKVVRDASDDIIVAGSTDQGRTGLDMLTIKYSGRDGSVLWKRQYNGPANGDEYIQAMALDSSGNVIVSGPSENGSNIDFYTAKYAAADGALLWGRRYDGPGDSYDFVIGLAVDSSGNVVVTGSSDSGTGPDFYTARYAGADGALLWEKRYHGPLSNAFVQSVAVDGNNDVIVTGYSFVSHDGAGYSDYYTAKYAAANGALLWEKYYNGPANKGDQAWAVAIDRSNDVIVTGISANTFSGNDYYTVKYATADGAVLWENQSDSGAADVPVALAVDESGNAVLTGASLNGRHDYYTAKFSAAGGQLIWEKRYTGSGNTDDVPVALAVDASGNVIVTGSSYDIPGTSDYYTVKYAAVDGALLWEASHSGAYSQAKSLVLDSGGNAIVTGLSYGGSKTDFDFYTAKYAAADGALLWEKSHNEPANREDEPHAVAIDRSGNVAVTGVSSGDGSALDFYTAKYAAADGVLLWEKRYNGSANRDDYAQALGMDGSGNVIVTGSASSPTNGSYLYTAKYAAGNGALLWERYSDRPENGIEPAALAVDGEGNVVVTGYSFTATTGYDFYTAKYAAADGAVLWEKRYDGAHGNDSATAVALDHLGNAIVTGYSFSGSSNANFYTAKYAATDGALLWERRYDGPATRGSDFAQAVAVDGNGNVAVTGFSANAANASYYDIYTAKYAAANGAILWEKRYDGPAHRNDYGRSVAVDGSGNVIAAGSSNNGTNDDFYTAKYAAADGTLLWEKRYNGPANGDDLALAVALDANGNAVVTGYSNNGTNDDYYTAKYAAADGALLWEKRYNGPANGQDRVATSRSLALGPNGMIAITGYSDGNLSRGTSYNFATVVYWENLPPVSIQIIPTGFSLRFQGVAERSYAIERATNPGGPWSIIATGTAPAGGIIEYTDTAPEHSAGFYRAAARP